MAVSLKQVLSEDYKIKITPNHVRAVSAHLSSYEIRQGHLEVLNTPLLGMGKMYFHKADENELFDIFDIDKSHFKQMAHKSTDVNTKFVVSSDPYNIFSVWLVYLVKNSTLPSKAKETMMMSVLKLMIYRFFTGVVNWRLPHGANEEAMRYTIDNLSAKFDIKKPETNTWKKLIESMCVDVLSSKSVHKKAVDTFMPGQKVLYVITDLQTRIRSKIHKILDPFFKNVEEGNRASSYNIASEVGGEKVLANTVKSFDSMIENVSNRALNVSKFVDNNAMDLVVKLNNNISKPALRDLLIKFSDIAVEQNRKKKQNLTKGNGSHEVYIGYRILISNIIQKSYRTAMINKIDMSSKLAILDKTKSTFRSSRISDNDILIIKNSVNAFVDKHANTTRASTLVSLKLAFITYILILSFKGQ